MPSPRAPRFKGLPAPKLPPRAQQLAETMAEEGIGRYEAGAKMGVKKSTARWWTNLPAFWPYYRQLLDAIRNGELGRNLQTAIMLREKHAAKDSAAHGRTAIEAMRFIEGDQARVVQDPGARQVTPGVVVVIREQRLPVEVDQTLIEVNPQPQEDA